ncbi:MAG: serine hydrolase, partial [Chitinophagaceae bacterium]|nr:serine hydrolase [Chitinophagaceae bacterium]
MKKLLIFGLLISQMTIAQKKATVPATYFPPKGIWEEKSPTAMGMDEAKLKEAIAFAIAHENAMPKNQELAQIYNFYKEPFSDALG